MFFCPPLSYEQKKPLNDLRRSRLENSDIMQNVLTERKIGNNSKGRYLTIHSHKTDSIDRFRIEHTTSEVVKLYNMDYDISTIGDQDIYINFSPFQPL